jgi:hypothetical protein
MTENKVCELLERCGFFLKFCPIRLHSDPDLKNFIETFCKNVIKSETCQHKIYYKLNNENPPDNMSPGGKFL